VAATASSRTKKLWWLFFSSLKKSRLSLREEAEQALIDGKLALGEVADAVTSEPEKIGKVMSQTPAAGSKADVNTVVAITIGKVDGGK
jgi:hypothetical protein